MTFSHSRAERIAAIALLFTVAMQIAYYTVSSMGQTPDRQLIWSGEVLAYLVVAMAGLALLPARPLVGAALGAGGLLNVVQAGAGLTMFAPLSEGGEALRPAFGAVLAFAFLLYYAGKLALGAGTVAAGASLWRAQGSLARGLGALAVLVGLAAILFNALAIVLNAGQTLPAGAAGSAAALLLALALLATPRSRT